MQQNVSQVAFSNVLAPSPIGFLSPQYMQMDKKLFGKPSAKKRTTFSTAWSPSTATEDNSSDKRPMVELFKEILTGRCSLIEFDSDGEMVEVDMEEQHRRRVFNAIKAKKRQSTLCAVGNKCNSKNAAFSRPQTSGCLTRPLGLGEFSRDLDSPIQTFKLPAQNNKFYKVMSVKRRKRAPSNPKSGSGTVIHLRMVPGSVPAVSLSSTSLASPAGSSTDVLRKILATPLSDPNSKVRLISFKKFITHPEEHAEIIHEFKKPAPNFHKEPQDEARLYMANKHVYFSRKKPAPKRPPHKANEYVGTQNLGRKRFGATFDRIMKTCAHVEYIEKFIERSVEDTRVGIEEVANDFARRTGGMKASHGFAGLSRRQQVAYLAKYNHM